MILSAELEGFMPAPCLSFLSALLPTANKIRSRKNPDQVSKGMELFGSYNPLLTVSGLTSIQLTHQRRPMLSSSSRLHPWKRHL